jgi:hypothetical protein
MTIRVPQVTSRDIEKLAALRTRFEPIAAMIGVAYDDSDQELLTLLHDIEMCRDKQARRAKQTSASASRDSQTAQAQALAEQLRGLGPKGDVGDQAVALMAARRGKGLGEPAGAK